jgi:proton-dependent oligopeptide transporter, POT family
MDNPNDETSAATNDPESIPLLPIKQSPSQLTLATTATPSQPSLSRRNSSNYTEGTDDEMPTNVSTVEQLALLPPECLSSDPTRPLQHFHEDGVTVTTYALEPMLYSVAFILVTECIERFCFYGINYTQTSYLTGAYNDDWNADLDAITASQYVSVSVAVAYSTPFIGAYLADQCLGDFSSILFGICVLYLPGLFLIALTTIPNLLGDDFNRFALSLGLLVLWPTGTGIVKSIVNVFGAKQFHPLLQSSCIESYYVHFYMCINIGALIGGVVVPLMAQENVTWAYFVPVLLLSAGMVLFGAYSSRFICTPPKKHDGSHIFSSCLGGNKSKRGRLQHYSSSSSTPEPIPISAIFRISLLVIPFNIVYSQMSTTFILQGTVMAKAYGFIDAACMNNADAIAVLFFGQAIGGMLYPYLATKGVKIPTTYKFAIGSALGAASIAWALLVEYWIVHTYRETGERISILYQTVSYFLIGAGEIFAVSAAYEVAFKASPPEQKVLFSAVNLFCIGGLPSVICIILYQICIPWFQNSHGTTNISNIRDYSTAHVSQYFWLLLILSLFGTVINVVPCIRDFVESIEERAADMIRTPKTPKRVRPSKRLESFDTEGGSHVSTDDQMLASRRHQYYLKYGSGPSLYKHGSMRAGPSLSYTNRNKVVVASASGRPTLNLKTLSRLYNPTPSGALLGGRRKMDFLHPKSAPDVLAPNDTGVVP